MINKIEPMTEVEAYWIERDNQDRYERFKRRIYRLNLSAIEYEEAVKRMTEYLEQHGRR